MDSQKPASESYLLSFTYHIVIPKNNYEISHQLFCNH